MTRGLRRTVVATAVAIVALLSISVPTAMAAWTATALGAGTAAAGAMPDGPVPTATPAGDDVTVAWDAVALSGGGTADYVVRRYDLADNGTNPNSGCAAVISGTSCTEDSVPEGRWKYTVATAKGVWRGAEGSKSTPAVHIPTRAPSDLVGNTVSRTEVALTWDDNSLIEDGYVVQRSDDGSTGWAALGSPLAAGSTTVNDTTLSCGVTKFYRVKATSTANDDSVFSEPAAATAAACPQAEASPTDLTADLFSATQIDVAWSDNATGETGYQLETSPDGSTWTPVSPALAANAESYSDTTLSCGTTRHYRVKALGEVDSNYSNVDDATTNPCATPPAAPTSLSATVVSGTRIDLSWTDNADSETKFEIRRIAGSVTSMIDAPAKTGTGTANFEDTVLCGTAYSYEVRAVNAAGDSDYSNLVNATSTVCPPAAPTGLSVTGQTATSVSVSWTDNATNEASFDIERTGGAGTVVLTRGTSSSNPTTYTDSSAVCGTTYIYKVRAVNAGGNSAYTSTVNGTTTACPPATPSNLTATAKTVSGGDVSVDLSWADNSNDETGFDIERTGGTGGTVVLTAATNATAFTDDSAVCGQTYTYKIRSKNTVGESEYTSGVDATTVACNALYVAAITTSSATQNVNFWRGTAIVTVTDHNGNAVNGVTVSGTWSPGTSATCSTAGSGASAGRCSINSGNIAVATTSSTFTVTDLTLTGRVYAPSSNVVSTAVQNKP